MTGIAKKVGRRYVEIGSTDREAYEYLPYGIHIIEHKKGCTSTRFNVGPDNHGLLKAFEKHRDEIAALLVSRSSNNYKGVEYYDSASEVVNKIFKILSKADTE